MSVHRPKPSSQSEAPPPMPEPSMHYIIQMFGIPALIWTGYIANPADEKSEPNLDLAKFQIGLLETVEKKTQGNLDEDETEYLASMLHNARMAFIGARDRLERQAKEQKETPVPAAAPEAADETKQEAGAPAEASQTGAPTEGDEKAEP